MVHTRCRATSRKTNSQGTLTTESPRWYIESPVATEGHARPERWVLRCSMDGPTIVSRERSAPWLGAAD